MGDVAEVDADSTSTIVACNNFKGGLAVQLSSCAQRCTVCPGL